MTAIMVILYNALLIGACGYVVFGLGHSGWWFLLAAVLTMSLENCACKSDKASEGQS